VHFYSVTQRPDPPWRAPRLGVPGDYGHRGTRYRESSRSRRKGDAQALLKKRMAEMGRGQLVGPQAERVTLDDLCGLLTEDYKQNGHRSLRRAECSVARLREFFGGDRRALDITTPRINAYTRSRLEGDGAKPATVQRELAALKRGFNLAVRSGLLEHVPHIPMPRARNTREGFFEQDEFVNMLTNLPEHLRPPMQFAYYTGWRCKSEVLPLTWAQVDFQAGTLRLEPGTTKNDEGREFPFTALPELEALLREQRERTTALEKANQTIIPYVFHREGERIYTYDRAWRRARVAARGQPGRY
jgi:integrase